MVNSSASDMTLPDGTRTTPSASRIVPSKILSLPLFSACSASSTRAFRESGRLALSPASFTTSCSMPHHSL
jgi:hypothetical protein